MYATNLSEQTIYIHAGLVIRQKSPVSVRHSGFRLHTCREKKLSYESFKSPMVFIIKSILLYYSIVLHCTIPLLFYSGVCATVKVSTDGKRQAFKNNGVESGPEK